MVDVQKIYIERLEQEIVNLRSRLEIVRSTADSLAELSERLLKIVKENNERRDLVAD